MDTPNSQIDNKEYEEFIEEIKSEILSRMPENPSKHIIEFLKQKSDNRFKQQKNLKREKKEWTLKIKKQIKAHKGKLMSFDIGGSLCKICIYTNKDDVITKEPFVLKECFNYEALKWNDTDLSFKFGEGNFSFVKFPSENLEKALEILKAHNLLKKGDKVIATGGGAYKYSSVFEKIGVTLTKDDEMSCLVRGIRFALETVPTECYFFSNPTVFSDKKICFSDPDDEVYPFILANIGTGVSILLVNSPNDFKRVTGTFIGGGTYLGLCKLLTNGLGFNDLAEECKAGDFLKLNITVKDIYGGDYKKIGLPGDLVASIFGKLANEEKLEVTPGDIALSMVSLVGANTAQLAYFCAKEHNVEKVLFAGNFLRQNHSAKVSITSSLNYRSCGKVKALFLEHEGYFGAIGAFLKDTGIKE